VTLKTEMPKKDVLYYSCRNINQATKALKAFVSTEEPHEIIAVNKKYLGEYIGVKPTAGMAPWTVIIVNRGADKGEVIIKEKTCRSSLKSLAERSRHRSKARQKHLTLFLKRLSFPLVQTFIKNPDWAGHRL